MLNLDLSHIEAKISELLKKDKKLQLINGELITKYLVAFLLGFHSYTLIFSSYYLDGIAAEINEMLQEAGQISLAELSSRFSLPLLCLEAVRLSQSTDLLP